jgi:F-type H+-transporting ATPase subunit a
MNFDLIAPISPAVVTTLIIVSFLSVLFIIIGIKVSKLDPESTPKGIVFFAIMLVEITNNFLKQFLSGKRLKFIAPYLFTIIVFLVFANTSALFGLTAPLSNIGVAMSFSLITFFMIKISEFKFISLKDKINGLVGPVKPLFILMVPINLIGEISTPFSMGLRLFVNLMSGAVITAMVYGFIGWFGSLFAGVVIHTVFDIFFGVIQAFVFFMLSTVNLSMATDV